MLFSSFVLLVGCLLRVSHSFSPLLPAQKMFWPDQQNNEQADKKENEEDDRLNQTLDSILKIHCTHSEPDDIMPWQKSPQSMSTSSGFVITSNNEQFVMTNAHSVEFASIIQVQRRGEEHKYEAQIEAFCNECDLAILRVNNADFWNDLEPLHFGPLPGFKMKWKSLVIQPEETHSVLHKGLYLALKCRNTRKVHIICLPFKSTQQ